MQSFSRPSSAPLLPPDYSSRCSYRNPRYIRSPLEFHSSFCCVPPGRYFVIRSEVNLTAQEVCEPLVPGLYPYWHPHNHNAIIVGFSGPVLFSDRSSLHIFDFISCLHVYTHHTASRLFYYYSTAAGYTCFSCLVPQAYEDIGKS